MAVHSTTEQRSERRGADGGEEIRVALMRCETYAHVTGGS